MSQQLQKYAEGKRGEKYLQQVLQMTKCIVFNCPFEQNISVFWSDTLIGRTTSFVWAFCDMLNIGISWD